MTVCGIDSEFAGRPDRCGRIRHAKLDVDAIDEILQTHVLGIDRDLIGVSQSGRGVDHVQLEDAVANLPRHTRGVRIERLGSIDAGDGTDRLGPVVSPLPLGMDGVDLKRELGREFVDRLHRRKNRFLPLLLEGADGPRSNVERRPVLTHPDGDLAAVRPVLRSHRDPAALAGKHHRDRTNENVDASVLLLDRIDLDEVGQFIDQLVATIPKTVGTAARASGPTLGHGDLTVQHRDLIEESVRTFHGDRKRPVRLLPKGSILVPQEIDVIGETDTLLDDHRPHRVVERVVCQFAEGVEERRDLGRKIVIGEFVLNVLDRR